MRSKSVWLLAFACTTAIVIAGCGSDSSDSKAPVQDWRSIDACSLVDTDQLAKLADDAGSLKHEQHSDQTSVVCNFTDVTTSQRLQINFVEFPAGAIDSHPSALKTRNFSVGEHTATVTLESSGSCTVGIRYGNVMLGIAIDPDVDKSNVPLGDKSSKSCDAQKPLIDAIAEKADLGQ